MSSSSWIAVFMPMFILFFVILPQQRSIQKIVLLKMKKRKGVLSMTNEIIKKYIGKNCLLSTGSFGTTVIGKIIDISDNWIEVETKKGTELINAEFIQNIKEK